MMHTVRDKDRTVTKEWSAGLYLRLSRDDDKYESESISSQRDILQDFVRRNPDITVFDVYIDDGFTGTNFDRPDFKRMEDDLRSKKINCIIVKDLSRFARNCIEIGNYLSILFPYLKTRFICVNDNVDSFLDPESLDNISTKFKNLINDEYCRDISVKVKSSLTIRRENGEYIGSFPCYGYKKDASDYHKLVIDEEAAEVVREIYKMFLAGESIRGIVRVLNGRGVLTPAQYKKKLYPKYNPPSEKNATWTMKTVRRILTNQMYVGDLVQNVMNNISYRVQKCRPVEKENYIIVPDTHEAIISREDFGKVADLLQRDTRESPKTQKLNVLSGFIKCGDCKRGMIKKSMNNGFKDYSYYICSTYKNRGKEICSKHTIQAEKVENAVLSFLQFHLKLVAEIEPLLELINRSPDRAKKSAKLEASLDKLKGELKRYRQLKAELYPDFKAGLIERSEYEMFRTKYDISIADIEERIKQTQEKIIEIEQGISPKNAFIKAFREQKSIPELTREVVSIFIENIYVYEDERIEIVMKFKDEYETVLEYILGNRKIVPESELVALKQAVSF